MLHLHLYAQLVERVFEVQQLGTQALEVYDIFRYRIDPVGRGREVALLGAGPCQIRVDRLADFGN